MRRDQVITLFLFLAIGGLGYLLSTILLPYAVPILWAIILALVFYPVYRLVLGLMPKWESLAAGLMTLLVFAVAVVPTLLLSGALAREAIEGYQRLSEMASEGRFSSLNSLADWWLVAPVWDWARQRMASGEVDVTSFVLSGIRWASEFAASKTAAIARNVFGFFVDIGIMGFALFFAFRDGAASVERLQQSIPMAEPDRHQLFHSLKHTILAVVQGLSLTALVQGILVGVGLWTLGVPFALLLGACAFVLAFLPVGGAALIWIPTAVCLALTGSYIRAGMLLMWGGLVVSSIDNIVRPYLISGQTRLSTPLLFFGIIGGLKAFGFIGLFLGPTLLAAFAQLMRIFREQYLAAPASSP